MKKLSFLVIFLISLMILPYFAGSPLPTLARSQAQGTPPTAGGRGTDKIDPEVRVALQSLPAGAMLTVIVRLKTQTNLNRLTFETPFARRDIRLKRLIETLQETARRDQQALRRMLELRRAKGQVGETISFWIFNGLAVTARPEVIEEIAARPEVLRVSANAIIQAPELPVEQGLRPRSLAEPNLEAIGVPALWESGFRGKEVVIASLDTGVEINFHADLAARWRGGSNSWFDPYYQHGTPFDNNGHGTWTMGVMVGGEDVGTAFGIAPEARWIAAKIFKDNGQGTALGIHQSFQWLLDPDGNPATADAPHVVNNSWTWFPGCNLEFQADLQALRAAGILPIFAAGNTAATSYSPANYPEAFAVGAVGTGGNFNLIWADSSQGPSACDGTVFPEVVAPGVLIHTTSKFGTYFEATGTSLAAPHVSGLLALLLDAYPDLPPAEQEAILLNHTVDLGAAGPDQTYGQGRINGFNSLAGLLTDLSLTQTTLPTSVKIYHPLTYTLAVVNHGPYTATQILLTEVLTSPFSPQVVFPSQGSCGSPASTLFTCTLGSLASGATATMTLVMTPTTAETITSVATVTGLLDLETENNHSSLSVSGLSNLKDILADLVLTQTTPPGPLLIYHPFTYTLAVANHGPYTATQIILTEVLTSPFKPEVVLPSQGSCGSPATNSFTCTLGSLASGATATVVLQMTPTTGGVITSTAGITGLLDLETGNNYSNLSLSIIQHRTYLPLLAQE